MPPNNGNKALFDKLTKMLEQIQRSVGASGGRGGGSVSTVPGAPATHVLAGGALYVVYPPCCCSGGHSEPVVVSAPPPGGRGGGAQNPNAALDELMKQMRAQKARGSRKP